MHERSNKEQAAKKAVFGSFPENREEYGKPGKGLKNATIRPKLLFASASSLMDDAYASHERMSA